MNAKLIINNKKTETLEFFHAFDYMAVQNSLL